VARRRAIWDVHTCSNACRRKRANALRKVEHETRPCAVCGEHFEPKRADAVTCSNRCRQKAHRQRANRPSGVARYRST
jgi:hypothetical protein